MTVGTPPERLIKPPAGEVPERSEGGGEVKEGESGRATAGSDKRPRLNNTHEQASYGQLGGRRRAIAHTAQKRLGSAEQCLDTAFSSDRGGAERVKHSGGRSPHRTKTDPTAFVPAVMKAAP